MSGNPFHTCSMGLHYVCYQLAKRGWYVSTPCRHAKSPAIGKCWRTSGKSFTFQTTGQRKKGPIQFARDTAKITEPFLMSVVNLDSDDAEVEPEVYVFTADEARDSLTPRGRKRQFIEVPVYNTDEFRERWDKLES